MRPWYSFYLWQKSGHTLLGTTQSTIQRQFTKISPCSPTLSNPSLPPQTWQVSRWDAELIHTQPTNQEPAYSLITWLQLLSLYILHGLRNEVSLNFSNNMYSSLFGVKLWLDSNARNFLCRRLFYTSNIHWLLYLTILVNYIHSEICTFCKYTRIHYAHFL